MDRRGDPVVHDRPAPAVVSHWFHTPQDLPDAATSPELLQSVATALLSDLEEFIAR
jgi:hypothetical protein